MKPLTSYFIFQARKNILLSLTLAFLPIFVPFILFGIVQIFQSEAVLPNIKPMKLDKLPQPELLLSQNMNLYYFSYSPRTEIAEKLIQNLLDTNGLHAAKAKAFDSLQQAQSTFASKNLQGGFKNVDLEYARKTYCQDQQAYLNTSQCDSSFIDMYYDSLPNIYKFTSYNEDEVFLHIDVTQDKEGLAISIVVNTTLLDDVVKNHPDQISKHLKNTDNPFWTSYGITLQTQIDKFIGKTLANTTLSFEISYLEPIQVGGQYIPESMFFGMAVLVAYSLQIILCMILANVNRDQNHVVLRRLGVSVGIFWWKNLIYVSMQIVPINIITVIVWHYCGVIPFSNIDLKFCLIIGITISFSIVSFSMLVSAFLGNKKSAPTLLGCIICFGFLLLPMTFSVFLDTIFDASLLSQLGVFTIVSLSPVFSIYSLVDGLFFSQERTETNILEHKWKVSQNLINFRYIFTDLDGYASKLHRCSVHDSPHGDIIINSICYYQVPIFWKLVLISLVQSFVCLFIISKLVSYIKSEKGHRGLPPWYFLNPYFYKNINIKQDGFSVRNLQTGYFGKKNIFMDLNLDLADDQTSALVGEAGQGKSTILSILAGEKRFSKGSVKVLGVSMNSDINAYKIKPFIGYCPQDFSNVWMNLSVIENITFSLGIRCQMSRCQVPNPEEYIQKLVVDCGLGDHKVQNRKAKSLSGGMLRRLAFCNAISGAKLLLLDEITAGVDPVLKRSIWKIIQQIQGSVLLTSHDMSEVQEMAQTVSIINGGKALVNNVEQFKLRQVNFAYELSLYKSAQIENQDVIDLQEALNIPIKLLSIHQHVLRVSLNGSTTSIQLVQITDKVDSFLKRNQFDDFQVSKTSISQYYANLIRQNQVQNESISQKPIRNPRKGKNLALLTKSLKHDFRLQKVPVFFVLLFASLTLSILTATFYYLFKQAFVKLPDFNIIQRQEIASSCFDTCLGHENDSTEWMTNCLVNRIPNYSFQKYKNDTTSCLYYLSWLGLDQNSNFKETFGDKVQHFDCPQYSFQVISQNLHGPIPKIDGFKNYKQLYLDHKYLYDPLTHEQNDGILPYFKYYHSEIMSQQCGELDYCIKYCQDFRSQYKKCNETFEYETCKESCANTYNCVKQNINVLNQQVYQVKTVKEGLLNYRNFSVSHSLNVEINKTSYNENQLFQEFTKNMPYAIINLVNETDNAIDVNISMLLPFTGHSQQYYTFNDASANYNNYYKYDCETGITLSHKLKSYFEQQGVKGARDTFKLYTSVSQNQPDRSHAQLMNIGSQPIVQFTAAVLRKHLFKNATDYSPWNFNYKYNISEMPVFATVSQENSSMTFSDMLTSMSSLELIVSGLFPLAITAIQVGREYELDAQVLFQIHGISQSRWAIMTLIYFEGVALALTAGNLLLAYIICPFIIVDQYLTVAFHILQSLTSVVSGLLIAIITKRLKPSSMIAFLVIILSLVFQFMFLNTRKFSFVISLFVPAYGFVYQQSLTVWGQQYDQLMFLSSFVLFGLQIVLIFVIVNWNLMFGKTKKQQRQIGEETSALLHSDNLQIRSLSHQYEKGVFAVKSVDFDVVKGDVFGLLGSNGSGKSTLLHCLTGIVRGCTGSAQFEGQQILGKPTISDILTIVPQRDILFQNLTVLDHVKFCISTAKNPHSINEIIKEMQIDSIIFRKIVSLSVGERRKVSIALALCANSQIIALDEPSCGLGAITKLIIQESVGNLLRQQKTIILTSHDMEEVESIVSNCIVMKDGSIMAQGSVNDLRKTSKLQFALLLQINAEECNLIDSMFKEQKLLFTVKFNPILEFYSFEFLKGSKIQHVLLALIKSGMDQFPWVIEGIQLERVFLQVVGEQDESLLE
ncbi:ABC transporter family protein [Spironucleus salmonicida]|uniref:ABC transporter family protein n=1 Tax=Spironucleus salmonicida TaxID=348837 RepID=V6LN24_9EUKA|nr:ABC transporter family protein [Spironucleus salmonicida]|eukprot:EST45623.1 ABC transporter family protein [Spironucleus salmonicida]